MATNALRLILGDQLSFDIPTFNNACKKTDIIMLCEVWEEATYVKHHKKKIAFLFSAMRHFAYELQAQGYNVHYTKLDDVANAGSFVAELQRAINLYSPQKIVATKAAEYRVVKSMDIWQNLFNLPVELLEDTRFFCTPDEFKTWAGDKKQLRMEFFYRDMRRKHNILMAGADPEGGEWNYDSENRKTLKPADTLFIPKPLMFAPDDITQEVLALVASRFDDHFGDLEPFYFATTNAQALEVLERFIAERLQNFGDYQDAMVQGQPWLYHSHIGFYLNCGLLSPMQVVRAAEDAYYNKQAPLNAVEGFIRQILGWREYVRGIYWLKMPEYKTQNFLEATRPLPDLYWGADTKMNCLKQCVAETKQNAYAHHIQRLMVLGNFALIAGLSVAEVNEWFLIVYADAYEWVELPNVSGMILFADGGFLGSKPYAASGAYINKMSDYCKNCAYKVQEKNGPNACPFNYLYWHFMLENQDKIGKNPRIGFAYNTLKKMGPAKIAAIKDDSQKFFKILYNR